MEKEYNALLESVTEMDTIISSLEEENKRLRDQIQSFRRKTTFRVFEENLRLAQELALLKGEISG